MKKIVFAILPLFLAVVVNAQEKTETNEEAKPACCSHCNMGHSILYMSPIKFTENGVGFELGYERGIDAGGIVAYNLPVVATFDLAKNDLDRGNKQDAMFYFTPGIKFYPTSSFGKVKYALGPSLVIGAGQQTDNYPIYVPSPYPYPNYGYYRENYITKDKFLLGVMINNSLNINPSDHFTLGLDFGLGFTYINTLGGETKSIKTLVQGGFKMGYRF